MSHAQQAALRAAFGSDSDDEAVREAHSVVRGLHLLRGFLSPPAQDALLAAVRAQGWAAVTEGAARNQAMVFGHAALPSFAQRLCADVAAAAAEHAMLPPDLLQRGPFNQLICNTYAPGQGICAHVDLAAFADGIASVSLGAAVVMDFQRVADGSTVAVMLRPGDLLTMHGEARYDWTHGIAARTEDEWQGATLPRGLRVSLTLRRMAHDVHVLTEPADAAESDARQRLSS